MTDIPQEALDALMEIEAEAVAKKLGLSLVQARDVVKELWDEGELEVRPVGDDKYILCQRVYLVPARRYNLDGARALDALAGDAKGVGFGRHPLSLRSTTERLC